MDYVGEQLLPGQLGRFFIVLSLVASAVAAFAYFRSVRSQLATDSAAWKKLARIAFLTEVISVFAIFGLLVYIIQNHLFEYKYAWQHSSRALEFKYLLASLWEGQEGSFLLWSIWHCVLGVLLITRKSRWEAPVMAVVSFAQFILATMIAGIYIGDARVGSNPFILLRDSGILDNAPALHINFDTSQPLRPDYLRSIQDGNDLNPLLQNYWMVIHPPVLFLGFASTLIPFAFAVAGLWTKKTGDWIRAALPWALFAAASLGVGIMMGGMWAYESLSFGGYWAWDPVENASLVPWLILIAGIHTAIIFRHSGHSLRTTYLFFILSFAFVLYSTFLTRSGILGDASVHAFTDLGMNAQLYLFLYFFLWLPAVLGAKTEKDFRITALASVLVLGATSLVSRYLPEAGPIVGFTALLAGLALTTVRIHQRVPAMPREENSSSREFWMFIGALVFFLSAIVIIGKTSVPVINEVFDFRIARPEDPEFAYNSIQIYVAIILALLTAITQYFRYRFTPSGVFWKQLLIPTAIAFVLSALFFIFGDIRYTKQGPAFLGAIWLATACSIYTIVANAAYIWIGLKGKLRLSGGSISHVGFGMVLLGILISSSNKEVLSKNTSGIQVNFGPESKENPGENLTLVQGVETPMGKYRVTYESDSAHPKKEQWYYKLRFRSTDGREEFVLEPNAFVNYKGNEGLMANPASRKYWDHDVFTYITSLPNPDKNQDTSQFHFRWMRPGDSLWYSAGYITLESLVTRDSLPSAGFAPEDRGTVATLKVHSRSGTNITSQPLHIRTASGPLVVPDTVIAERLVLMINSVEEPDVNKPGSAGRAEIGIRESNAVMKYLTLKAYRFPFINLLWLGVVVTAVGILISMARRIQLNRREQP